MSNLEKEIREIIAEIIEKDSKLVILDANLFEELGADSMMALEILAAMEKKYRIVVPEDKLPQLTTLRKIMGMVQSLKSTKHQMLDARSSILVTKIIMAYKSYKDLDIYKKAHKLAIEIHDMTLRDLPNFEMYEEGSQIRKSSKSIKSTIVEGFGRRRYKQEFIKFLIYSLASCDETLDHLVTLQDTKSFKDTEKYKYLCEEYDHLGKMINNFIKSVDSGHKTERVSSIQYQGSKV